MNVLTAKFNLLHGTFQEYIDNDEYFSFEVSSTQDKVSNMYNDEVFEDFEAFYITEGFTKISELIYKDPDDGTEKEFTWQTWADLWDELREEFVEELVDTFVEFLEDKLGEEYKPFITSNNDIIRKKAEELPYEWEL